MNQKNLLDTLAGNTGSVDEVLSLISEMCEELRQGRTEEWENPTLLQFLEAMGAWLETMGPRVGEPPSWKFLEALIQAAKVYE